MRKILAFTSAEFKNLLTYPGMVIIWMIQLFIIPTILLLVWLSIIQSNPSLQANRQTLINYYTLLPLIAMLVAAWPAQHLSTMIRTGNINSWLTKPFQPLINYFSNNIASKAFKFWFLLPLVIIGSIAFNSHHSPSLITILVSLIFIILGAGINLLLNLSLGLLGFWLDEVAALENLYNASYFTFGGRVIPFFLFPGVFKQIATFLPFRYIASFPLEIINGTLNQSEIILGVIIQLVWIVIGSVLLFALWKKGIKRFEAYGG